jgi:hypothetical protein
MLLLLFVATAATVSDAEQLCTLQWDDGIAALDIASVDDEPNPGDCIASVTPRPLDRLFITAPVNSGVDNFSPALFVTPPPRAPPVA